MMLNAVNKPSTIQRFAYLFLLVFIAAGFCAISTSHARTQDQPKSPVLSNATVKHARSHIMIDGLLNESDWSETQPIGEIRQREPHPGDQASERTEVKLLFDEQNIYVGVICFDSEPRRIIATQMARDSDLSTDDKVEIVIDPFHDHRNGFYFATNPAGVLVDALVIENGQIMNLQWDSIWNVRTARLEQGWSAEFAIPFRTLSFKAGQKTWGFNFSRTIKRKFEADRWSSPRLDVTFQQVSQAGNIEGLSEVEQGLGIDIRPFVSGDAIHYGDSNSSALVGKPGGDVFYNLTPSLKWSSTFNTDFGETEVDDRQINLTRFPLFFPEKRAFFLENTGIFNFGVTNPFFQELMPFFSRNIGVAGDQEIPITAGTKLTGKAGRFDIGVMDVQTRDAEGIEGKDFLVTRVKRNLFSQSYVGGIFTNGNPTNPGSSQTYGVDLNLATSNFLGSNRNFQVTTYFLKSANEGIKGKDHAYGFAVNYPNDLWNAGIEWGEIQENFQPELGFVMRGKTRKLRIDAVFSPRPKNFLNIRQMYHEFRFNRYFRLDYGKTESWQLRVAPVNYQFNSGDRVEMNYAPEFQRLFEKFEISQGVVLPAGDYRFNRYRLEFETASKRKWEAFATWWFGTYYSGNADQISATFAYKIAPHFQVSLGMNQTFARLKEGHFIARIYSLRADYSFTPFLTLYNLVQFDNATRNLGWQSRLRWIVKPGNDIFLVFNQGWIQDEQNDFRLRMTDRKLSVKIQYTFRL
jgi:hypothetical protein